MDSPKRKRMVNVTAMKLNTTCMAVFVAAFSLAGCTESDAEIVTAFDGIAPREVVTLSGTEPFWNATIQGAELTYTTPDNMDGTTTQVTRFAGNGGLSFAGTLDGQELSALVTPGECSDGMSEAVYPFTATVQLGDALLTGCAYTDRQPRSNPEGDPEGNPEGSPETGAGGAGEPEYKSKEEPT